MKDISRNLLHLKNLHSGEVCHQLLIVRPGNEAKVLQLEEQIAKARVQLQAPWQGQGEQEKPQLWLDLDFSSTCWRCGREGTSLWLCPAPECSSGDDKCRKSGKTFFSVLSVLRLSLALASAFHCNLCRYIVFFTPDNFSRSSILKAVAELLFRMFPISRVTLSRKRKVWNYLNW